MSNFGSYEEAITHLTRELDNISLMSPEFRAGFAYSLLFLRKVLDDEIKVYEDVNYEASIRDSLGAKDEFSYMAEELILNSAEDILRERLKGSRHNDNQ